MPTNIVIVVYCNQLFIVQDEIDSTDDDDYDNDDDDGHQGGWHKSDFTLRKRLNLSGYPVERYKQ